MISLRIGHHCGGSLLAGTDGNGVSIEYCSRCDYAEPMLRAPAATHPTLTTARLAALAHEEKIQRRRANYPLCARRCGRHVGTPSMDVCPECSAQRRRDVN